MGPSSKKIILSAILAALSVTVGYLFLYIPNVEMITASVFISGVLVGPFFGMLIGVVAESLYSIFNPFGMPMLPLLFAQVAVFGIIGFSGGLLRNRLWASGWDRIFLSGMAGFGLTLLYDVLTTMSFVVVAFGLSLKQIYSIFATGMLFYVIHIGVNTFLFAVLVPVILSRLKPHLPEYIRYE